MNIFKKNEEEMTKEVSNDNENVIEENTQASDAFDTPTPAVEEALNTESTEENKEVQEEVEGTVATDENVTIEENPAKEIDKVIEELVEEEDKEYVILNPREMIQLREEVNKLCRMNKGKFNFRGLKISARE